MKRLLKDLEAVRSDMEDLLNDETVTSLPKAYNRIKDNFDSVLQDIEDGNYSKKDEEEIEK